MGLTEVRTLKLSDLRGKEDALFELADSRRRENATRFKQEDDRLRSLAAGWLMKNCLPGYSEEGLSFGGKGKPFLREGPAFSISHGGDFVVIAWNEEAEGVGIDVEPIRDMEYYRSIIPMFANAEEQQAIGSDASAAARVWTRKESLFKSVGEGVSDLRELPGTLYDHVMLLGVQCAVTSWAEDGHMFSVAIRGIDSGVAIRGTESDVNLRVIPVLTELERLRCPDQII